MGSRNIEKGDYVCILFGCSVPVILRGQRNSKEDKTYNVSFVCESFLYGKMDGEVLIGMDAATLAAKTVEFVLGPTVVFG
jgi:hypothetical protein